MDHAALQGVLALLMDGKPTAAVAAWNRLDLAPQLEAARLQAGGALVLTLPDGQEVTVALDRLIAALDGHNWQTKAAVD